MKTRAKKTARPASTSAKSSHAAPRGTTTRRPSKKWFMSLPDGTYLVSNSTLHRVRLKGNREALWTELTARAPGEAVRVMASKKEADRFLAECARAMNEADERRSQEAVAMRRCVLAWISGPNGEQVPIHATSTMTRARRAPSAPKHSPPWLQERAALTTDNVVCWWDRVDLRKAKPVRLVVDVSKRNEEKFPESIDVGLCQRLCHVLTHLSNHSGMARQEPLVVLWGPRADTDGREWALYFLGEGSLAIAKFTAVLLAATGVDEGIAIESRRVDVPDDGSVSLLLRYSGDALAMYNRDGREAERLFESILVGHEKPPLEVRLGTFATR